MMYNILIVAGAALTGLVIGVGFGFVYNTAIVKAKDEAIEFLQDELEKVDELLDFNEEDDE